MIDAVQDAVETDADNALWNDGFTYGEEMWTEPSDGLFENHLEARAGAEAVEETENARGHVGERFEPYLSQYDNADWDDAADQTGRE